jgi:hypothetical protein
MPIETDPVGASPPKSCNEQQKIISQFAMSNNEIFFYNIMNYGR